MSRLEEMQVFVRVVEAGSLTAAAEQLDVAKSAISRRLAELEHRLGARLLTRTTRSMSLTDAGQTYLERAREEVRRVVRSQTIAPECAGRLHLLELIVLEAMRLYPPAPNLMRRTLRPVRLGPVELGAGAIIVIPIYVIHRHRRL